MVSETAMSVPGEEENQEIRRAREEADQDRHDRYGWLSAVGRAAGVAALPALAQQ